MSRFTPADFLVVALAREIPDDAIVSTGVLSWLPMLAIGVARESHAPRLTYLNCAGAINPGQKPLPASSTDSSLLEENSYCLRLTDLWDLAASGSIDLMFFGFAQLDRKGNTNLSWLKGRNGQRRKLGGVAGAFALRQLVRKPVLFTPRHVRSAFVSRVDAVTTVAAANPVRVVTDLGVFTLSRGRLEVVSLHPTASLEEVEKKTRFPVRSLRRPCSTPPPSAREWRALERLDPSKTRNRYGES